MTCWGRGVWQGEPKDGGQKGSGLSHSHICVVSPHNSPKEKECGWERWGKREVKRKEGREQSGRGKTKEVPFGCQGMGSIQKISKSSKALLFCFIYLFVYLNYVYAHTLAFKPCFKYCGVFKQYFQHWFLTIPILENQWLQTSLLQTG